MKVLEKEYVALFLGFLRQFLQTELQPRVDLKMYLNRWTTQTCYFNYSGRNLLEATEQNTECIHEVHAQASFEYFMCQRRNMLHYFSDFFDNFYKQNSNPELI